jgi:hypothetical protein
MSEIYKSVINTVTGSITEIMNIFSNVNPNSDITKDPLINDITTQARSAITDDSNAIMNRYNIIISNLKIKIIPYYNDLLIKDQSLTDLYNMYLDKNKGLDSSIKTFYGDSLTNNRKTFYESMALETVVNWNTFFMYLYFTLLFAFVLGIIFSPHRLPKYQSITICIILFLYPFLVDPLWQMIYNFFGKVYNLYPKNVYNTL